MKLRLEKEAELREILLLKTQANAVFHLVQQHNFEPTEFRWEVQATQYGRFSTLVHQQTNHYFVFVLVNDNHFAMYSPGAETPTAYQSTGRWEKQMASVAHWLRYLKREVEAPDLWSVLAQETELTDAASTSDTDNTPFTTAEQEYISQQLGEIQTFLLATHTFSEEQAEFVRKRLDYLEGAARRSGRVDWVNQMVGVLFSIIIGAAFAPDQARELFRFAADAFRGLLAQFPPLP